MSTVFRKAHTLEEVGQQVVVEPLDSGDPRYTDLSAARGTKELARLGLHLQDFSVEQNRFAKVAFTGPRGCGKSTELLRLEEDLRDRFVPIHLFVDESLLVDCDYTDLMLWLVHEVVRHFNDKQGTSLTQSLIDDVVDWFAEKTLEKVDEVKSEIKLETEAEAKTQLGFFAASLKLLARIKSSIVGSTDRRRIVRSKLQSYSSELIAKVNLVLDDAHRALGTAQGQGSDLLIVQDNLDRLPREAGRRLFFDHADLLKALRAHVIYTVPSAFVLCPYNISQRFESLFTLPMVGVRQRNGKPFNKGVDGLIHLLDARVEINDVFASRDVVRKLVAASGGNIRDLMRLVNEAQLTARVSKKTRIDAASAREAEARLRLDYEKLLAADPGSYRRLARVHRTKRAPTPEGEDRGPAAVEAEGACFTQLVFSGSILEYNGKELWYDVHPVIQNAAAFKEAIQQTSGDIANTGGAPRTGRA